MANSGGPWGQYTGGGGNGGGPKRPFGGGPSSDKSPFDLDDLLNKVKDGYKKNLPTGSGYTGNLVILLLMASVALWLLSGFYRVESDQVGIEMLFGKWENKAEPSPPGLHYYWPYPIGSVERPVVTRENRITIGFRPVSSAAGRFSSSSTYIDRNAREDVPDEGMMLTGDENIVDIDFIVFWRIKSGGDYLFNVRDPEVAVKTVSESVLREVVGKKPIVAALTERRREIEQEALSAIQTRMDSYGTGVSIKSVQLLDVAPPSSVIDSFNDVQRSRADKEKSRNQAEAYRNSVLPVARGEAVKLVQEAEAYRQQVVSKAEGDAKRFTSVYNAYKDSKDVTSRRLYLETLEDVLQNAKTIVVDGKGAGSGVVPYLPLPEVQKKAVTPPAAPASPSTGG
jgi:membrane protease subunit HflK